MSLACGLVGLPGSGKTTIYNAITAAGAGAWDGAEMNRAVVELPEPRIDRLVELYSPAKIVPATLEVVDIPGITAGSVAGQGRGARLLGHLKDVDAIVHVVRCFPGVDGDPVDPPRDVETVDLEMMVADVETLRNKIHRLGKKSRGGDRDAVRETADCERILAALEEGTPARGQSMSGSEQESVRECNLVTLKPVVYVANVESMADAEGPAARSLAETAAAEGSESIVCCGRDEADISQLDPGERTEFLAELGLESSSMERLLRAAYRLLGLVNFFTAGPKEVHVWTCRDGDTAPVAAGKIHTDMERGFIRMEVIRFEDLDELGGEAEVAHAGRRRLEGKEYVVRDGDIVVVRFNPA